MEREEVSKSPLAYMRGRTLDDTRFVILDERKYDHHADERC